MWLYAQKDLESVSDALRIPGSKSLGPIARVRGDEEATYACHAFGTLEPGGKS